MRIVRLSLKGYKRFKLANIAELELNTNNDITVITATNGYGKSSLLRELTPLPPVRTDFNKEGSKDLRIEHEGHIYDLRSDFTNRTSPHSFKVDGEELNTSGTTDVQEELCEKHFNINTVIRNIIFGKVKLCSLTKAERKNLFLSVNPMDLTLILDTFKKAQQLNKKCKNNLQHLYTRKADIESKLISDELLVQHEDTCVAYRDIVSGVEGVISELRQHISHIEETYSSEISLFNQQSPVEFIGTTKREFRDIRPRLVGYRDISRDSEEYQQQYAAVVGEISSAGTKRDALIEQLRTLGTEADECKKYLESTIDRPISKIEEELEKIYTAIKAYGDFTNFTAIPEHELDKYRSIFNTVNDLVLGILEWDIEFIPVEDVVKLGRDLDECNRSIAMLNSERTGISNRITDIDAQLATNINHAQIPSDCGHNNCGLKSVFVNQNSRLESEKAKLSQQLVGIDGKLVKLETAQKEYSGRYAKYSAVAYVERYNELAGLLYRYFNTVEDWSNKLLNILGNNPTDITVMLQQYITRSSEFHQYQVLITEKTKLEAELAASQASNATSSEFIRNKLKRATDGITSGTESLQRIGREIVAANKLKDTFIQFRSDRERIRKLASDAEAYAKGAEAKYSVDYWKRIGNELLRVRSDFKAKEAELLHVVKEQTTLHGSYKTEVLDQIKIYENDQKKYTAIEAALSPTSGIAHKSMLKYLNAVIANVNYFIGQIWSYPMRILPYEEDQAIDYGFKIEVGDDVIPDINQLSDGQTEVVNLAFVLTILLQLRMLDKVPFFADEIGRTFDSVHRMQILKFLGRMVDERMIEQLFLVNHFALFTDGFTGADIVCLSPDTMTDLPRNTNQFVTITR